MGEVELFAIGEGMYSGEASFSLAPPSAQKEGEWCHRRVYHGR